MQIEQIAQYLDKAVIDTPQNKDQAAQAWNNVDHAIDDVLGPT